jgi:HSP20 family protein
LLEEDQAMAKKRRRKSKRRETLSCNVLISSIRSRVSLSMRGANEVDPEVDSHCGLEVRGTMDTPIRDVHDVKFNLWVDADYRIGPNRPAYVGYITHTRPEVAVIASCRPRMLAGFYARPQEDLTRGAWVPAVDIYSNGQHELVLKAELPDMKEEEIDLTVEDNILTLRGEKKLDTEVTEEQFHRIERSYGSFARTFALPPTVDAGKVRAEYKAGVLTVRLPLREEAKRKQIKVEVAA